MGITASQPQTFIGYEMNMTSTSLAANGATGAFNMSGNASLIKGHLYSISFLTGTRLDDVATVTNGTFSAVGVISYQSGVLKLALSSFSLTLNTIGSLDLQGTIYKTVASPIFAGNMTLIGSTNCQSYCGTYGQCIEQNATYACVCDCGWMNDASLGTCALSTTSCPSTLTGESAGSNFNSSSTSCGGSASVSSPPLDEGKANIYRPIISFIPIICLVCILALLLIAMHNSSNWISANQLHRVSSGRLHSPDQPVSSFSLEFDLCSVSAGPKQILDSMFGMARSGEVVGLLGPSGSGKSTLLNILSGEIGDKVGSWRVNGSIKLGGKILNQAELARSCAYVPQQIVLPMQMTVEETLCYAAAIRLGANSSVSDTRNLVEQTLDDLGISHIRHSFTGSASDGDGHASGSRSSSISGGERLRVAIGMEIVTEKSLILLDEPTSGLDAYNALNLLQLLSRVAKGESEGIQGAKRRRPSRIVIISLHQPSSALFNILDRVALLAQGSLVSFCTPSEAPCVFDSLGLPAPSELAIAEHMLMVTGNPTSLNLLLSKSKELIIVSTKEPHRDAEEGGGGDAGAVMEHLSSGHESLTMSQAIRLSWRKAGVLFWRSSITFFRQPALIALHLVGAIALGLLVGFVFFRITVETTAGTTGRLGTLFFSINIVALTALSAIEPLLNDRPVAQRELLRSYYSAFTYMNIKLCLDGLFLRAIPAFIYGTLFYWLAGMRSNASAFTLFLGVLTSFNALIGAMVVLLTVLLGFSGRTLIASTTLILIFTLFAGFLAPERSMTWALRWICYVSPFRWAWQALVVNEVRPLTLTLAVSDLPSLTGYPGGLFLSSLGIDPTMLTTNIIVLICEYGIIHLLCILALHLKVLSKFG